MQITYQGTLGFSIKGNDATVALALDPKQVETEDVIVTRTPDDTVKAAKNQTVMDWPGEYESRGVAVMVIPVGQSKKGRVVKLMIDDIAIAHLTDVSESFTEAEDEKIGNIDILFTPVGSGLKLPSEKLRQMIESIDPRMVIPMGYQPGEEKEFAKSLGFAEIAEEDVLKLKKSDLPADRMDMRVLKAR